VLIPTVSQRAQREPDLSKQLKILVVDDDRVTRIAMDRLIEALGHTVALAANGREAITALSEAPFDIVLMDLSMPVMDGLSATRAIRNGEAGQQAAATPIIALTASGESDIIQEVMDAGVNGYIGKPIDIELLEAKILQLAG